MSITKRKVNNRHARQEPLEKTVHSPEMSFLLLVRGQLPVTVERPVAHVARQRLVCINTSNTSEMFTRRIRTKACLSNGRRHKPAKHISLTIIVIVRDGHRLQSTDGRVAHKAPVSIICGRSIKLQVRKVHSISVTGARAAARAVRAEPRRRQCVAAAAYAAAGGGHHGHGGADAARGCARCGVGGGCGGGGAASVAVGTGLAAWINHGVVAVVGGIERVAHAAAAAAGTAAVSAADGVVVAAESTVLLAVRPGGVLICSMKR